MNRRVREINLWCDWDYKEPFKDMIRVLGQYHNFSISPDCIDLKPVIEHRLFDRNSDFVFDDTKEETFHGNSGLLFIKSIYGWVSATTPIK